MKVNLKTIAKKMMRKKGKDCHDSITWKHEFEYHKQIVECLKELKEIKRLLESEGTK